MMINSVGSVLCSASDAKVRLRTGARSRVGTTAETGMIRGFTEAILAPA